MADVLFACAALRELVCSGSAMKRAFPGEQHSWRGELWNQGIKDGVIRSKCQKPIVSEEGFGLHVSRFPARKAITIFHRRFPAGDYWEVYAQRYKRLRRLRRL
jgi:hypothetical protein